MKISYHAYIFVLGVSFNALAKDPKELADAIKGNNIMAVKTATARFPELRNSSDLRYNSLAWAVRKGQVDFANYLIQRGWSPDIIITQWGKSILNYLPTFLNNVAPTIYQADPNLYQSMLNVLADASASAISSSPADVE